MTSADKKGGGFGLGKGGLIAGLLGMLVGGGAVALWAGQDGGKAATGEAVRDYLLANPEIIPEAMQRLQDREMARAVQANRAAYETPFAGAWAGAADGDVVLVEFFDYACSFCRKSNADVERLLREDRRLKMVWRELPVLGPDSEAASRVSLAAARAGKFKPFHDALFALGRPTPEAIEQARRAAGVGPAETGRAELDKNYQLAQAVRATGTPTFVVGDRVMQGAVGYEVLKGAIAEARGRRAS